MNLSVAGVKTSVRFRALDIVYAAMFAALMAIGANITSFVPFMVIGGVPITLQSFFAILAGAFLGKRLGAISMMVYAFMGLIGLPVFAQFKGGFDRILSPAFGFVLSFIVVAYVVGYLTERSKSIINYIIAMIVGIFVNYLIGVNWMYFAYKIWADAPEGFSYKLILGWNAVPFPKDIILAVLAGIFAHRMRNIIKRTE